MKISKSLAGLIRDFNEVNSSHVFLVNDVQDVDGVDFPCLWLGEDDSDQSAFYVDQGDGYALRSASERFRSDLPVMLNNGRDLRKAVVIALNAWEV